MSNFRDWLWQEMSWWPEPHCCSYRCWMSCFIALFTQHGLKITIRYMVCRIFSFFHFWWLKPWMLLIFFSFVVYSVIHILEGEGIFTWVLLQLKEWSQPLLFSSPPLCSSGCFWSFVHLHFCGLQRWLELRFCGHFQMKYFQNYLLLQRLRSGPADLIHPVFPVYLHTHPTAKNQSYFQKSLWASLLWLCQCSLNLHFWLGMSFWHCVVLLSLPFFICCTRELYIFEQYSLLTGTGKWLQPNPWSTCSKSLHNCHGFSCPAKPCKGSRFYDRVFPNTWDVSQIILFNEMRQSAQKTKSTMTLLLRSMWHERVCFGNWS